MWRKGTKEDVVVRNKIYNELYLPKVPPVNIAVADQKSIPIKAGIDPAFGGGSNNPTAMMMLNSSSSDAGSSSQISKNAANNSVARGNSSIAYLKAENSAAKPPAHLHQRKDAQDFISEAAISAAIKFGGDSNKNKSISNSANKLKATASASTLVRYASKLLVNQSSGLEPIEFRSNRALQAEAATDDKEKSHDFSGVEYREYGDAVKLEKMRKANHWLSTVAKTQKKEGGGGANGAQTAVELWHLRQCNCLNCDSKNSDAYINEHLKKNKEDKKTGSGVNQGSSNSNNNGTVTSPTPASLTARNLKHHVSTKREERIVDSRASSDWSAIEKLNYTKKPDILDMELSEASETSTEFNEKVALAHEISLQWDTAARRLHQSAPRLKTKSMLRSGSHSDDWFRKSKTARGATSPVYSTSVSKLKGGSITDRPTNNHGTEAITLPTLPKIRKESDAVSSNMGGTSKQAEMEMKLPDKILQRLNKDRDKNWFYEAEAKFGPEIAIAEPSRLQQRRHQRFLFEVHVAYAAMQYNNKMTQEAMKLAQRTIMNAHDHLAKPQIHKY